MKINIDPFKVSLSGYTYIASNFVVTNYMDDSGIAVTVDLQDAEEEDSYPEQEVISVNLTGYGDYPEDGAFFIHHEWVEVAPQLEKAGLGKVGRKVQYGLTYGVEFHINTDLLEG